MNSTPVSAPTPTNWLSIAVLGLIWGGTFMVISVALRGYGPITVACARTTLGALTLLALCVALRRPWPRWSWRLFVYVVVGALFSTAIPFVLLAWGQQHVPSAFAGLSMAAVPLFVLPFAHFMVPGDELSLRKTVGFLMGFAGALVLLGPGIFAAGSGDLVALGRLACLAAAMCYAISSIATRLTPAIDAIVLSAVGLVLGAVVLIPLMLLTEGVPTPTATIPTLAIILLGLLPTAFAALLRVAVIRTAGPSFMTLVNYQVPVWSMILGALILSEALPGRFFAALMLILTGLAISQWATLRDLRTRVTT
ncbi:DMT family transporter [Thalassobacter stenotrophicus]|uniref:EamA-like transporter family protein n=2 Tax=Thalassobacter stenotrophicus TaxID=266809 RepID=A0ABY1IAR4_9RHOB|nr:DMT family transporter [Thalassobacter stenotrophicus]PVZ47648.1 EamA/RhaT family transporter [Thalassobacter stenotrophicus]CUH60448.1 putative DMT superfamily transporter inner membrane protein [Thalassobacter stenotrophicus]SHI75602.1 EamA-like transporter family protein [Thalassobacter stenotrophicus DSM 16310]